MFDFAYGSKAWVPNADGSDSTLTYYYAVSNTNDGEPGFSAANSPGVMSDLSGTFLIFNLMLQLNGNSLIGLVFVLALALIKGPLVKVAGN